MRCLFKAFIHTAALLCCLPACRLKTTCTIAMGKSVYAFPEIIMNMSNQTSKSSSHAFEMKVVITQDLPKECNIDNWTSSLEPNRVLPTAAIGSLLYSIRGSIGFFKENQLKYNVNIVKPESYLLHQQINVTANAESIFESLKGQFFDKAKFVFAPSLLHNCSITSAEPCSVTVSIVKDNAPTIHFETAYETPRKRIKSPLNVNKTLSYTKVVELEIKNIDSEVEVSIDVVDSDYFVNNPDKFDYCTIHEPNITSSAALTFYNLSHKLTHLKPDFKILAFRKNKNAWWTKNSSRINETLWNVRFEFAVSALISAIDEEMSRLEIFGDFPHVRSLDATVNITLHVTATSGRTNPQKTIATFILILNIKRELLSATTNENNKDIGKLSQPTFKVTAAKKKKKKALSTPLVSLSQLIHTVPAATEEMKQELVKNSSPPTYTTLSAAYEKISTILFTLVGCMCCGTVAVLLLLIIKLGYLKKIQRPQCNLPEGKCTKALACVFSPVERFK